MSLKVLIVDDERMVAMALRRTLAREYDVTFETDPRVALARILRGEHFDLITCDLSMPGVDGERFYDQLTKAAPEQARRVLFVSGGVFTPRAKAFLARVPNRHLDKLMEPDLLRKAMRCALDELSVA